MSLATRCTACGTAFRVVQDQLKVSEGWVRCGRCNEVFNALEGLFDLERETSSEWDRPATSGREVSAAGRPADAAPDDDGLPSGVAAHDAGERHPEALQRPGFQEPGVLHEEQQQIEVGSIPVAVVAVPDPATFDPHAPAVDPDHQEPWIESASPPEGALDQEIDAHLFGARRASRRRTIPVEVNERDRIDFSDARFDSDLLPDAADDESAAEGTIALPPLLPLETAAPPEFLRRAEHKARWQRPQVQAALALAALCLLGLLVLQSGHHFRDLAAARWPALRPALVTWCEVAGCRLEAPRRIDDIAVESTALSRVADADAFRLAVTLRSRASVPVAVPWVDLSLTDASGRLVARRALGAGEFEPVAATLSPGGEVVLQTLLAARNARVTGYTVEIFYP